MRITTAVLVLSSLPFFALVVTAVEALAVFKTNPLIEEKKEKNPPKKFALKKSVLKVIRSIGGVIKGRKQNEDNTISSVQAKAKRDNERKEAETFRHLLTPVGGEEPMKRQKRLHDFSLFIGTHLKFLKSVKGRKLIAQGVRNGYYDEVEMIFEMYPVLLTAMYPDEPLTFVIFDRVLSMDTRHATTQLGITEKLIRFRRCEGLLKRVYEERPQLILATNKNMKTLLGLAQTAWKQPLDEVERKLLRTMESLTAEATKTEKTKRYGKRFTWP